MNNDIDITPGFWRIEGLGSDRDGCVFVKVTPGLTVWGLSVYDDGYEYGMTARYRTHGFGLADALALWPQEHWHPDHDRRAEAQAEHDARTADTRMAAHRLTVTPATLHKAEGLGFEPGSGDVLTWALMEIEDSRAAYATACSVATGLNNMLSKARADRDSAAAKERVAVVAWVRDVAATASHNGDRCAGRIEEVADSIEAGDHLEVTDVTA